MVQTKWYCKLCNNKIGPKLEFKQGDLTDKAHPFCLSKQQWEIKELILANAFAHAVGILWSEMDFVESTYILKNEAQFDNLRLIKQPFELFPILKKPISEKGLLKYIKNYGLE